MGSDQDKHTSGRFDSPSDGSVYFPGSMAGRPDPSGAWGGMSTGWAISSYLLSGILVWGGVGILIDRLAGTPRVFTAIGMVLGAVLGIYLVYVRYGRGDGDGG
jgi:ATP synthase protein I